MIRRHDSEAADEIEKFWNESDEDSAVDPKNKSKPSMLTEKTCKGDFFDVSNLEGARPQHVKQLGGGIKTFLNFLVEQQ